MLESPPDKVREHAAESSAEIEYSRAFCGTTARTGGLRASE
jgi:hypothetical protein